MPFVLVAEGTTSPFSGSDMSGRAIYGVVEVAGVVKIVVVVRDKKDSSHFARLIHEPRCL